MGRDLGGVKGEKVDRDLFVTPFGGNTLYRPKTYSLNTSLGRYYSVWQAVSSLELETPPGHRWEGSHSSHHPRLAGAAQGRPPFRPKAAEQTRTSVAAELTLEWSLESPKEPVR